MTKHAIPRLTRTHFLDFAEVTDFVEKLAAACPELVSLGTLGVSREGRPLYNLTLTDPSTGTAGDKPAYQIHANIHASELSGTHAALATARRLVVDHLKTDRRRGAVGEIAVSGGAGGNSCATIRLPQGIRA